MPDPKRYEEFADLVRLHTSQVLAYIRVLLLNWHDAEDLFQETCLVLWQKFDEFEPAGENFLAWALRIAEHKVMDFQKKYSPDVGFHRQSVRDVNGGGCHQVRSQRPPVLCSPAAWID